MKIETRLITIAVLLTGILTSAIAQQAVTKPGVLDGDELKRVIPTDFFFEDQVAPVQMRNAVAVRTDDGKIVAAGLVDNSGYSADVAQKYQGFFISSKRISIEGQTLAPGEYGFGFTADGKFRVMDAGVNEILAVDYQQDSELKRPVPLKIIPSGQEYRLYAGKKYVTLNVE